MKCEEGRGGPFLGNQTVMCVRVQAQDILTSKFHPDIIGLCLCQSEVLWELMCCAEWYLS
jgi:hypothetical protein